MLIAFALLACSIRNTALFSGIFTDLYLNVYFLLCTRLSTSLSLFLSLALSLSHTHIIVGGVDICAMLQQGLHHVQVPFVARDYKCRRALSLYTCNQFPQEQNVCSLLSLYWHVLLGIQHYLAVYLLTCT
jgi:hypothetical protein